MALTEVVPGLFQAGLGFVNVFILLDGDEVTVIDTGVAGSAPKILAAVGELGKRPQDVRRILVTHLHADHTGGLAELKRQTGAQVYMHPADAALVRQGLSGRPSKPAPGLIKSIVVPLTNRRQSHVEPVATDVELADGQEIGVAGGLCAVATPGHTAGHVAFLWPAHGGALIVGDAAANYRGKLAYPILWEDAEEEQRTLKKIAGLDFEVAVFGHGRPILKHAADQFRAKWGRA
jgi:glyoxylase-like metal-dependent hydrolase (beta-lactamase superfamily II)